MLFSALRKNKDFLGAKCLRWIGAKYLKKLKYLDLIDWMRLERCLQTQKFGSCRDRDGLWNV